MATVFVSRDGSELTDHECWIAYCFADGSSGASSSGPWVFATDTAEGTSLAYDAWVRHDRSEVVGWRSVCSCGFLGRLHTRQMPGVGSGWGFLPSDDGEPPEYVEGYFEAETRAHVAPFLAALDAANL